MVRWDVLAATCCSFVRGSTLGSSVYTAKSYCLMGVYWVSVPFQSWDQNPKGTLSFCCLRHTTQPIPSRVTGISNLYGRPAWEKPRTLLCFTNRWFCCFNPQSSMCPLFTRWCKALCWVGNKSPPKLPKSIQRLAIFSCSQGLDRLLPYQSQLGQCMSYPTKMTPQNVTVVLRPWVLCEFAHNPFFHRCSSKVSRVSCSRGKSSHVNIIWSMQWTYFVDVGKQNGQISGYLPMTYCLRSFPQIVPIPRFC